MAPVALTIGGFGSGAAVGLGALPWWMGIPAAAAGAWGFVLMGDP